MGRFPRNPVEPVFADGGKDHPKQCQTYHRLSRSGVYDIRSGIIRVLLAAGD